MLVASEPEGRKQALQVELSRDRYVSAQGLLEPESGALSQRAI